MVKLREKKAVTQFKELLFDEKLSEKVRETIENSILLLI